MKAITLLLTETARLSWQWSAQRQESGESWLTSHVVSSQFVGTNHKCSKHWY